MIDKSVNTDRENKKWKKLEDDEKWYWFTEVKSNEKYMNDFKGLNEIFEVFGSGIETKRDKLFIDFDKEKLINRMIKISTLDFDDDFKEEYRAYTGGGYNFENRIKNTKFKKNNITNYHYRPFDFRYVCYNDWLGRPSQNIMKHIISNENIGIIFTRGVITDTDFDNIFISNKIIDRNFTNYKTYFAPIYLYEKIDASKELNFDEACKTNFKAPFLDFLKKYLGGSLLKSEDYPYKILSYIYAVLYAPTYRSRYKEDLQV
ncbi:hypothetical protein OFP68_04930 [Brachyspira hyodysenteriae]|uniref:type ISP restriction/modification enzyme n=1 Tax=Brachyspira hyodysenteriae TaxID=159 RepID=UPI0022CD6300|nr:type ISP restriction/modification enzyme [Brachyspira hyodysenteriae]MCZ9878217.1 hypothetical protein [Brachyspira hyodysenteriae]